MSYAYPDRDDKITVKFIEENELHPRYWEQSEVDVLNKVAQDILRLLPSDDERITALDWGCGGGRLIPWLAQFSQVIDAYDPDVSRLNRARELHGVAPNVTVNFFSEPPKGVSYSLALSCHVLQHIKTTDIEVHLRTLFESVRQGGLLVVAYCRQTKNVESSYAIDSIDGSDLRTRTVTEREFNDFIGSGFSNELPIHYIDQTSLHAMGRAVGWQPLLYFPYHTIESPINSSQSKKIQIDSNTYDRDIFEIWHKEPKVQN